MINYFKLLSSINLQSHRSPLIHFIGRDGQRMSQFRIILSTLERNNYFCASQIILNADSYRELCLKEFVQIFFARSVSRFCDCMVT